MFQVFQNKLTIACDAPFYLICGLVIMVTHVEINFIIPTYARYIFVY